MFLRVMCVLVGHQWDRRLRDGHPHKRCQRCELREWSPSRPSDRSDGAPTTCG
jgi:hypothetical protein